MIVGFLLKAQLADAYDQAMAYRYMNPEENEELSESIARVLIGNTIDHKIVRRIEKTMPYTIPDNAYFTILEEKLLLHDAQMLLEVAKKIVALLPQLDNAESIEKGMFYLSKWYSNGRDSIEKEFVDSLRFLISILESNPSKLLPGYTSKDKLSALI